MLRNIREVLLYELGRNVRRKGYLFATFGVPILLFLGLLLFNIISSSQQAAAQEFTQTLNFEGIKRAGYVDESGLFTSVPEKLQQVLFRYPNVEEARAALTARAIDVFYVIAPDYMETGDVTQHLPGFSINLMNTEPIKQLAYQTFAAETDAALLNRLATPANITEYNLERDETAAQNEDADFAVVYVFTITFLMGLFMTNGYLMQSVIEEKESRLIEILISTISPFALLVGKILALGILGILQIVGWIASLVVAWQIALKLPAFQSLAWIVSINFPLDMLPLALVYFVLGYLFFAAIYAAIGGMSNSIREGPQYAAIFTIPAIIPFYMFTLFLETPNATLPVVLSILPVTAPIAMLMRLTVTDVPALELVVSIGVQIVSVIGVMWVAARLFRVQTLLAGSVPRLRDLPKLLRG